MWSSTFTATIVPPARTATRTAARMARGLRIAVITVVLHAVWAPPAPVRRPAPASAQRAAARHWAVVPAARAAGHPARAPAAAPGRDSSRWGRATVGPGVRI